MAAIKQHAIIGKRVGEGMSFLSFSSYSCFGLILRHMAMPNVCFEMQNKLSKTRGSQLGSTG